MRITTEEKIAKIITKARRVQARADALFMQAEHLKMMMIARARRKG
jgi:hypothetical protein